MIEYSKCPLCGGSNIGPWSFTPEGERPPNMMHFAQSYCRSCDLVFSNPMYEADDLADYYAKNYYEDDSSYVQVNDPALIKKVEEGAEMAVEGLKEIIGSHAGKGIFFDIGAGYGNVLLAAKQLGFEIAGVEPSESAVRFAKDAMGLTEMQCGMFRGEDWPENWCDFAYAYHVIEHVPDLPTFVRDVFRILKSGGVFYIGTENHRNSYVFLSRLKNMLKFKASRPFQTSDHHTFYFSDRSLRRAMEMAGFEVIKTCVYTGAPKETLKQKLARHRFRNIFSKCFFLLQHLWDCLPGRGNRVLVWSRKPSP